MFTCTVYICCGFRIGVTQLEIAVSFSTKRLTNQNWERVYYGPIRIENVYTTDQSELRTCILLTNQVCGRVSQFRFKKNFALKRYLAKQKQFRFSFAKPHKKSFASFRFVSLRKFRFVSLKKRFALVVSQKKKFCFISGP